MYVGGDILSFLIQTSLAPTHSPTHCKAENDEQPFETHPLSTYTYTHSPTHCRAENDTIRDVPSYQGKNERKYAQGENSGYAER